MGLAFGASLGSWLGWRSADPLLDDHQMVAQTARTAFADIPVELSDGIAANTAQQSLTRTPSPFGNPEGDHDWSADWQSDLTYFVLGGDDYRSEQIHLMFDSAAPDSTVSAAAARMRSAGWHTYSVDRYGFTARKGDLVAEVTLGASQVGIPGQQEIAFRELLLYADRRHDPALVLPSTTTGALLGLVAAWLLAAAITRRLSRQRLSVAATASGLFVMSAICVAPLVLVLTLSVAY